MIASVLLLVLPLASHSLAAMPNINSVVVVGGTHGNEYTGVWCIRELEQPSVFQRVSKRFPSLKISTLLGNPDAHLANKRFIHTDLNREFTSKKLQKNADRIKNNEKDIPIETRRAQELNKLLGPKEDPKSDVIVDLHTTTTNMGITIIIPERDPLMAQAAAYVLQKCLDNPVENCLANSNISDKARIIMHSIPDRNDRPNLSSVGQHGFTIEVGPVPQGVIRHDVVEKTKLALGNFLEFLHKHNTDSKAVLKQIEDWFPSGRVPCYRSAQATRPGEMSGKIQWPCADHNPNFPAYMIHKSIQDQDFQLLKKGDPLFVNMEGDVIPYDGSHGENVFLMFINEGGYYYASSGTGIGVAVETEYDLKTADFVDASELCELSDTDDCSLE